MKAVKGNGPSRFNRIKAPTNFFFNLIFLLLAIMAIFPFFYIIMISLTDKTSIAQYGYSVIPHVFSWKAYEYLWNERYLLFNAFRTSIIVTVSGTILGLFLTSTIGYALSRRDYKLKPFLTYFIFIPMIFSGGMVSSFVINTQLLHLQNSYLAMILPLALGPFNIILMRSFFQATIPTSVLESAQIDGANQYQTFARIVTPLAKPAYATIGLFLAFGYWNDWFQASIYMTDSTKYPLQYMLMNIQNQMSYVLKHPELGVSMSQYIKNMPSDSMQMAIAVVTIIPIACAYPFFQRYFITGLTVGAVKG